MNVLIVHAHHEPKSFSSALARHTAETLRRLGHSVEISDLYAEHFNPVSGRHNFTSVKDPAYLKQQAEETYASEVDGFAPDVEREMKKLEACDLLIFNFPLWWFGMPAILKGWVDRVFAMGRIYGGERLYESGLGQSRKRAMMILTTGGGPDTYSGYGMNPPLATILAPVQHGVFWFDGFLPLAPFVAWSPAHITPEERAQCLEALEQRLTNAFQETPQSLPPMSDFPDSGKDVKKRFMVTVTRPQPVDEKFKSLIAAEGARLAELKRSGVLLASHLSPPQAEPWRGFLHFREVLAAAVQRHLDSLPLAPFLKFEITELGQF